MEKFLFAIALLATAVPASAEDKQAPAKAQTQGVCQPGPIGRKYRDFASCYAINIKGGWKSSTASDFCHKLCSQ